MKLVRSNAVKLCLPCSMCIHPIVNISCVKPYHEHLLGQPVMALGPIHVMKDCNEEYEVEQIVDSWYKGKHLEYLIHWKGWLDSDCTWEPLANLGNVADAVHNFHARVPFAPCHLHGITPFNFLQLFHYVRSSPPVTLLVPFDCLEVDP